MPDWILHMGASSALGKKISFKDLRWLLLGAVLPDAVSRVLYAISDIPLFEKVIPETLFGATSYVALHTAFHFYHTPFVSLFLAIAISLWVAEPKRVFLLIWVSSLFHFFLDLFQKGAIGSGSSLLFPFSLKTISWQIVWYDSFLPFVFILPSLAWLLYLFFKNSKPQSLFQFKFPFRYPGKLKMFITSVILLFALGFPFLFLEKGVAENINSTLLCEQPERFEGKEVGLPVSRVTSVDPLVVVEGTSLFKIFPTVNIPELKVGDYISLNGIYSNHSVHANMLHKHRYDVKIVISILGALLLGLYMFFT